MVPCPLVAATCFRQRPNGPSWNCSPFKRYCHVPSADVPSSCRKRQIPSCTVAPCASASAYVSPRARPYRDGGWREAHETVNRRSSMVLIFIFQVATADDNEQDSHYETPSPTPLRCGNGWNRNIAARPTRQVRALSSSFSQYVGRRIEVPARMVVH